MEVSSNKTAIITGSSSGVGKAIALALAAEKVTICLIVRRLKLLETVAAEARRLGGKATCHSVDLASDCELSDVIGKLTAGPNAVDILVHSAAFIAPHSSSAPALIARRVKSLIGITASKLRTYFSSTTGASGDNKSVSWRENFETAFRPLLRRFRCGCRTCREFGYQRNFHRSIGRGLVKNTCYYGLPLEFVFKEHIAARIIRYLLGLVVVNLIGCALAVADKAQSFPSEPTKLQDFIQVRGIRTNMATPAPPAYPLKASANNRYLVDQNDMPFLMVGDAPQNLIVNLSRGDAAEYMANRQKYGINTLWISILCVGDTCRNDASTFDGIVPFTAAGDLSTPNPVYFQRVDNMLNIAAANGMVVLLDPIETIKWLETLRANGIGKAFAYGEFLGNRYKDVPNIIWMHGNDFQSWRNARDDALVQAVARGIRSMDPNHIHTVELNYPASGSSDDPSWVPLIDLDAAYTYRPTYAQVLAEYNRKNFKPVFMVEANYEFESLANTDGGSTQNLRRQEYWTMLSGATGQLYGSFYSWRLADGWKANLDTPGIIQLGYMKNLFVRRKWYDLVPDQTHEVVVGGYDGFSGLVGMLSAYLGSISTDTYVTAARTSDGTLVMVYLPSLRTVTVDLSKLAGPATASWYDPASGQYISAGKPPLINLGKKEFTPPGKNAAGDGDWVLVLETAAAQ